MAADWEPYDAEDLSRFIHEWASQGTHEEHVARAEWLLGGAAGELVNHAGAADGAAVLRYMADHVVEREGN